MKHPQFWHVAARLVLDAVAVLVMRNAGAASPDDNWDSQFGVPGSDGSIWAITIRGHDVYVGGSFSQIGAVLANNIAKWDGTNWSALGAGLTGSPLPEIHALVFIGDDLYAGGFFTQAGGITSQGVAKWNGTNWSSLAGGVLGGVRALAVSGGNLIAGGTFSAAGGLAATNMASWDGTSWTSIGSGIPGIAVDSLAASGTNMYAGGRFRLGDGINATNIAKWNGSSWTALGEGIRDFDQGGGGGGLVRTLLVIEDRVVAAGKFRLAGKASASNIAYWDGITWESLGGGIENAGAIYTLTLNGTDLYAGGHFGDAGGVPANAIARWDGARWSPLGTGIGDTYFGATVLAVVSLGSELFVGGGGITTAGGKPANNIALWRIPHSLNIQLAANAVALSWPATGTNFLLETCSELGSTNWQAIPDVFTIVNNQCVVTNTIGPSNQFYRLRRK